MTDIDRRAIAEVTVLPNPARISMAVAARLLARLADVQSQKGTASLVLTGGRTGIAVLDHVRHHADRDAVDWSRVDLFWGDERFVPRDHAERNERQAREALLDHIPLDERRVHPMEPSDGRVGDDPEAAAAAYREVLAAAGRERGDTLFDICLLGVGEDGHVASLFPKSPAVREDQLTVVAVRDSPKPPPTRVTLTLPAICRASEVWLMTWGIGKADAVATALSGVDELTLPAAGARGRDRTLWFLDTAAASAISRG